MAYRDDLTALAARHDALASEVAGKTRELEDSRRLLDQARARAKLPVLDNLRVATPCTADWNQMTGDERVRHCGDCKKDVYNLSDMTRDDAEALLIARNGDLCVRYYQRHDGTILLADCAVGVTRRRRRRWIAAGAATLLAGAGVAGMGASFRMGAIPRSEMVMGAVGPAPQTAPDQGTKEGRIPVGEPVMVMMGLPEPSPRTPVKLERSDEPPHRAPPHRAPPPARAASGAAGQRRPL